MAKIINIAKYTKDNKSYETQIENVCNKIAEIEPIIMEMAINVACKGVWKKWNDQIKVGSNFEFDAEDLFHTSDNNVTEIMNLWRHACDTINVLSNKELN